MSENAFSMTISFIVGLRLLEVDVIADSVRHALLGSLGGHVDLHLPFARIPRTAATEGIPAAGGTSEGVRGTEGRAASELFVEALLHHAAAGLRDAPAQPQPMTRVKTTIPNKK